MTNSSFDANTITIQSLAQFSKGQDWRLQLAHDRPYHLLVWITRGQGLALLNGTRRGVGAHNALFIPAHSLFALDLGRQTIGNCLQLPMGLPLQLPEIPRHLRIRDVHVQSELTGLIEATQREQQSARPLSADALEGYGILIAVWLRRQILLEEHTPARGSAGQRLSQRFCAMLPERFATGATMAAYAGDLGVTPTHLTRAVKAATGKTAADLLTERILHEARRLLVETSEPAQNIARHLGFGSAAYFTRFMQQHTNMTPSKLRGP
ncbi:Transcriptional regulator, AraC family protein [Sulfitobacter noctilucae]|uniref:helix-turn-helix domain-containing protein n=1 Tax=Sulfitobacter noctilucae TaxID=1342302 RepID=UPI00046AF30B|nr:AraC family transcriptional regulator [Sulfitobacter noctilucae]KIN60906.1 Transcriptional regulator, AraC family protein [Sulfitobacter noctilucae]